MDGVLIAGIVNVTPDSFSDGGLCANPLDAVERACELIDQGADWIDIGGESTRPGAAPVPLREELKRVVPTVKALHERHPDTVISVDTSKPEVAAEALAHGASVINDVTGLGHPEMATVITEGGGGVVLMHMRGSPETMQADTDYRDLMQEVSGFLSERLDRAVHAGIPREKIYLDPGVGFGKDARGCARLIAELGSLSPLGCQIMVGASRKSFIGTLTGQARAADRLAGSLGAALAAVEAGVDVLRVHDVAETRHALTVFHACRREGAA